MTFTLEQISKARQAKSTEELLELAKESGVELTEEQAKEYFSELHKEGELSDEELDNVAGGKWDDEEPQEQTEYFYPYFADTEIEPTCKPICPNDLEIYECDGCAGCCYYVEYTKSGWRCNGHHERK